VIALLITAIISAMEKFATKKRPAVQSLTGVLLLSLRNAGSEGSHARDLN